jgi:CspA family cold shock protein
METGIVQWFNDAKGFGFVKTDRGDQIICEKWHMTHEPKTMKERQRISFRRDKWQGRDVAREITVLQDESVTSPILNMKEGKVYCEQPLIIVFENAVSSEMCDEIIKNLENKQPCK